MSPEEIQQREFSPQMRGYNQGEVRDFLKRVSAQVAAAQGTDASSEVQGVADVAPLSPEDDRFEALGDRIAGLLRSAHESAAAVKENADNEAEATVAIAREASELMRAEAAEAADAMRIAAANDAASERTAAEDEAEQIRSQARSAAETANQESERLRAEAEQYKAETETDVEAFKVETEARALEFKTTTETAALEFKSTTEIAAEEHKATTEASVAEHKLLVETEMADFKSATEAEAAELRETSLNAGETELADKREDTNRLLEEAQVDRETAMSELADARSQVTELLEQARNQSDFLKHEADEIIRGKVRTQVERAEERLQVLRNSEVASRDRIATAHAELTAAMERLDSSPVPELAADTDVEVLEAAKARGEETNWGGVLAAPEAIETEALEADVLDADVLEADVVEAEVVETEAIDYDIDHDGVETDVVEADDQGEVTMAEVFGDGESQLDEVGESDVAEAESFETEGFVADGSEFSGFDGDAVEADVVDAELGDADFSDTDDSDISMPVPPMAPTGGFGSSLNDTMSDEMADHTPIEADDSELLNTFEVDSDVDHGGVEADAHAFGIDTYESEADEAPVYEENSFDAPSDTFADTTDHNGGLRHDDPISAPLAPEPVSTGFDRFGTESDESADRIPVGVGASEAENTAPENEDALARLVREAMQRAVDSARSGD